MKTSIITGIIALTAGAIAGSHFSKKVTPLSKPTGQIKLEQILSIKELHLVRQTYSDIFFLHRKNNTDKPVRAIVTVPVTISAYIDLKQVQIVQSNDSITAVILPRAKLNQPVYDLEHMLIRKTKSFNVSAGKDLYPEVSEYLRDAIIQRMDSITQVAIETKICERAESEAKAYIQDLLKAVDQVHVKVEVKR
jgi:hypothetical protein